MATAVRFEQHGDGYVLRFAYDATLVSLVKTVPGYARSWQPESKVWIVDAIYARELAASMRELGYAVTGLNEPKAEPPPAADWARVLFRRVGKQRTEPVFRALTRILHPDNPSGDTALQRELNTARDELPRGRS